jgi:hypothetical protein
MKWDEHFKGTVSRDGFGIRGHVWLVLGLNKGLGHFFKFVCCSNDLYLNVRVHSPGFLDFYWSAWFGTLLLVSALDSHWLDDC